MENKAYIYVQNKLNNSGGVKIISGSYIGLIVDFGKVVFNPDESGSEEMRMSFEYNVHNRPDVHPDGWEDCDLIDFLGDVLINILDDKIQDGSIEEFVNPEM